MNQKEKEILIILQEECAEVIQEASKIFRFGFESCYPTDDSATSRERLTLELGQVLCMIGLLVERNVVDEEALLTAMEAKKIKLKKWSTIFDDEKEKVLDALSELPLELLVESVDGIYRLDKFEKEPSNPAAGFGNSIVLYNNAFGSKQSLA